MARLPQPGADNGSWGDVLNDYLLQSHTASGQIRNGLIDEPQLSAAVQTKLNTNASTVLSVAGKTGYVLLNKTDVGLTNVDNTSDLNKPVSAATQAALNTKATTTSLAPVATSGAYNDLTGLPVIPRITASPTAPLNPAIGDAWIDLSV